MLVAGSSGLASPPMGEAVATVIPEGSQDRANALINSGASVGVALSGPAALLVAEQWRAAWAAFALVGGAVVAWNALAMPSKPVGGERSEGAAPTDVPGLSVRYLVGTGSTVFWTLIGISGLAGGLAGELAQRFGLTGAFRVSVLSMAAVIGLLAAAPGVVLWAYSSAALFGSTYIMLTGIILLWSVSVFHERPSAGLGAAFLLIAVGQVFGALAAGAMAGAAGLVVTFCAFAGVAVAASLIGPRVEQRSAP